jgi:hypothetical protein
LGIISMVAMACMQPNDFSSPTLSTPNREQCDQSDRPFSKQAEDLTRHLIQALYKVVDLCLDRHADAMNPFKPLKNPTQGWPLGRLLELIWHPHLLVGQLLA